MLTVRQRVALALLIAVWLAVGLFGREPWKPDEAYTFGLVHHMLKSGDWVVPSRAEDECRYVLETLRDVYKNDAQAKEQGVSPEER